MQPIEIEAKTVEEAIELACRQLKATPDRLAVEVLEQTPGMLRSLFAGRRAKIRAQLKTGSPATAQAAGEGLGQVRFLFERIVRQIEPNARLELLEGADEAVFNVISDGSGIFIGKRGQTLEALQYLLNKIRLRCGTDLPHVIVDSEGYRQRHVQSLVGLAMRLSEKAKKKGGPVTTNPMNAADRRVIHLTLKEDAGLTTWSKGEGGMRKVIIAPRQ
jgi:spoIIIJ-associated protein